MIDLAAIRARAEAATEGPWETEESHGFNIWRQEGENVTKVYWKPGIQSRDDMEFIAAARTDVPALLQHIDNLTAKLATARADAMEVACRAVCEECRSDLWLYGSGARGKPYYHNVGGSREVCKADAIRRAFAETEEAP